MSDGESLPRSYRSESLPDLGHGSEEEDTGSGSSEAPPSFDSDAGFADSIFLCCRKQCYDELLAHEPLAVEELARLHATLSPDNYTKVVFDIMATSRKTYGIGRLHLCGKDVCSMAFQKATRIKKKRFLRLLKHLDSGNTEAPVELRHNKTHPKASFCLCIRSRACQSVYLFGHPSVHMCMCWALLALFAM